MNTSLENALGKLRPLVGVTCGTSQQDPNARTEQDRLNRAYSRALWEAGAIPVIVPNLADETLAFSLLPRLNGMLFTGGVDVSPARFHEETWNETVEVDTTRDETEFALLQAVVRRNVPLFAICRGFQVLNVALGGTLYQDLPTQYENCLPHRQEEARDVPTHSIAARPGSRFAEIIGGTEMRVNSFHHQALREVAPGLTVVARAEDGVIEAVENRRARFLLGVQFHPEETFAVCSQSRALFEGFVQAL